MSTLGFRIGYNLEGKFHLNKLLLYYISINSYPSELEGDEVCAYYLSNFKKEMAKELNALKLELHDRPTPVDSVIMKPGELDPFRKLPPTDSPN